MKKLLLFLCVCLSVFLTAGCVSTAQAADASPEYPMLNPQQTVAVVEFVNKTKYGERRLSDSASEILTSELARSGSFILVERQKLDEVMEELNLQLSGMTATENAAEIGNLLNCKYLLIGTVSNFGVKTSGKDMIIAQSKVQAAECEVDIRIVDVETGAIIYSAYGKGTDERSVSSAFGVGQTGGYDETLAGNVMRKAIQDAVLKMIKFFQARA